MSKYTLEWAEKKTTSTGKEKIDATLKDEQGNTVDKVTIWADFPNFSTLMPGSAVVGDVVTKVNGKFTNKTLYPQRTDTLTNPQAPAWAKAKSGMAAVVEKKQASIEKSMDRKESSIEKLAVYRDTTLITNLYFDKASMPFTIEEYDKKWKEVQGLMKGNMEGIPF